MDIGFNPTADGGTKMKTTIMAVLAVMALSAAAADSRTPQSSGAELAAQIKLAQSQLAAAQKNLTADTKALEKKKTAEKRTYRIYDGSGIRSRKGTGDTGAQAGINELEVQVRADKQEVAKWTAEVARLQKLAAAMAP